MKSASPAIRTAGIAAAVVLANFFQLFVLPLALLPASMGWAWTLLALVPLNLTLWALIHEAIHQNLPGGARMNAAAGRLLAIVHGAPFGILQSGHLLHHRYNRTVRERAEVYDPRTTPRVRAAISYYFRLLGGLYAYEALTVLLCLLPARVAGAARRRIDGPDTVAGMILALFESPARRRELRVDALLIVALYGASAVAYGAQAWLLALVWYARALAISLNDNAYHYGTPLDDVRYGRDLAAGPLTRRFLLNFNLHGAHHLAPRMRWSDLPASPSARSSGGWWSAIFAQLAGPIAAPHLPTRPA